MTRGQEGPGSSAVSPFIPTTQSIQHPHLASLLILPNKMMSANFPVILGENPIEFSWQVVMIVFSGALGILVADNYVGCCTAKNHPHLLKKLPHFASHIF